MKGTLEFDFADPEDKRAAQRAVVADEIFFGVSEFLEECRRKEKYDGDERAGALARELISQLELRGVDVDALAL